MTGVIWEPGTEVHAGRWTALDTETLMIDDTKPREVPELVLMTSYGGGHIVDLIMWDNVPAYLDELKKYDIVYVFHNAPFDMRVTGLDRWMGLIDRGRIDDTGLQWILYKMGTVGLSDEADEYPKLARVVKDILGQELEKDNDVRCTFERGMVLDDTHAEYACGDAVATWLVAHAMAPDYALPPTMDIQVKGFVCLDDISRNGMLVDRKWMAELRQLYAKEKDESKMKLKDFGINVEKELETKDIIPYIKEKLFHNFPDKPSIDDLRMAFASVYVRQQGYPTDAVWPVEKDDKKRALGVWAALPWPSLAEWLVPKATAKQLINILWKAAMNASSGLLTMADMREWWDEHDGWPAGWKQEGLATQLQRLMSEAEQYCSQPFPRTPSGKIALDDKALEMVPKVDIERLKFLQELKTYKHAEKMISTYLDEKIIRSDGRVHPRYVPTKSTGRTSCRSPFVILENVG